MALINGTSGDDTLYGTTGADRIRGFAGEDLIFGSSGIDSIDGGPGIDFMNYAEFPDPRGVFVNNTGNAISGVPRYTVDKRGFGEDRLFLIESFVGSNGNDTIHLGPTAEFVAGLGGNDRLFGPASRPEEGAIVFYPGSGNDTIRGAPQGDILDYGASPDALDGGGRPRRGVEIDIDAGRAKDGWGDVDVIFNIVSTFGTDFADRILGSPADEVLYGWSGADFLHGRAGNDFLYGDQGVDTIGGGAGDDVVSYHRDPAGVTVDLKAGFAVDGWGASDELSGLEQVEGSDFGDRLYGSAGANWLVGRTGDDLLDGRAGDDGFLPGEGNDTIYGGDPGIDDVNDRFLTDVVSYEDLSGPVSVWFGSQTGSVNKPGSMDVFDGIEIVIGTPFADRLWGADGTQGFVGLAGNDTIVGGPERDFVYYDYGDQVVEVRVNLAESRANDPFGTIDTLSGIEIAYGGRLDDFLVGDDADNELFGMRGDDRLIGAGGDDLIDGGAGRDTAVFFGRQATFTVVVSPSGPSVIDRTPDRLGTDRLDGIETLEFADVFTWPLDEFAGGVGLAECDFRTFVEFYIAYFDRAPDAQGLFFWATAFAQGLSLEAIAADWLIQPEFAATYPPGLSNDDFATEVYQNVLGRTPDPLGYDFWVRMLDSGTVGRDVFILEVLRGAKAPPPSDADSDFIEQKLADRAFLADKTDIGIYFAATKGMSDVTHASEAMAVFDGSEASKTAAAAAIAGYYADAVDPVSGEFLLQLVGVVDDPFAAI